MGDEEGLIGRVAAELRVPVRLDAGFDARLMAAVRAARRPGPVGAAWEWLRAPRAVAVSPLGGLALAALLAGLIVVGAVLGAAGGLRADLAGAPAAQAQLVQFVLHAPEARRVSLAGDFNGWDVTRTPLRRSAAGLWWVAVPLVPGRYAYTFVLDGTRFVADPAAPRAVGDDFGAPSSVVIVNDAAARARGGAL